MQRTTLVAVLALVSGCSVVKMHRVRDDYLADDAAKTRRLVLVVRTDADPKVGELFATVYKGLGIDPSTQIRDNLGRPLQIAEGKPLKGIV